MSSHVWLYFFLRLLCRLFFFFLTWFEGSTTQGGGASIMSERLTGLAGIGIGIGIFFFFFLMGYMRMCPHFSACFFSGCLKATDEFMLF